MRTGPLGIMGAETIQRSEKISTNHLGPGMRGPVGDSGYTEIRDTMNDTL